jgi:ATP-binding cassette subfamily F protein 3
MKTLAGELEPLAGERLPAARLTVGYFAQHRVEQLDVAASPLAQLRRVDPRIGEQRLRDFLGGFGFRDERVEEPVARLSGGEQARLALAVILFGRPNLLLLDEPTNHLDLEMRLALNVALQTFSGAVVLVSHDRHLLRSLVDDLYLVADRRVTRFDGDLEDYAGWLAGTRRTPREAAPHEPQRPHVSGRARRQAQARQRAQLKPLRDELERLEGELARLGEERSALEALLADATVYQPDAKDRLEALLIDRGRVEHSVAQTETLWIAASERLERAADEADEEP